jgi:hypothetical protein
LNREVSLDVGDTIDGRYELRREISRGKRSVVFEAQHVITKRSVAVKLARGLAARDKEERDTLLAEAKLLGEMRHPSIVEALDAGTARTGAIAGAGVPYFVMDMFEGKSLAGVLAARGKLSLNDTLRIGMACCRALACMHRSGVIHCDLRPRNVFLPPGSAREWDSPEPDARVLSFGAAVRAITAEPELPTDEAERSYLSPEQLRGEAADERSDIYALGVILYESLTGKLPTAGDGAKSPHDIESTIPRPFSDAVMRALAAKPEDRYEDGKALAQALWGAKSAHANALADKKAAQQRAAAKAQSKAAVRDAAQQQALQQKAAERASERSAQVAVGMAASRPSAEIPATARRRTPRAAYITPVRVKRGDGGLLDGRCEDISEGGMLLIASTRLNDEEKVHVHFALPITGTVVDVLAVARWVKTARDGKGAIGVQFADLPTKAHETIAQYVAFFGEG